MYSVKRRKKMTVPEGGTHPAGFNYLKWRPAPHCILIHFLYIYTSADSATRTAPSLFPGRNAAMKTQRLDAIRDVLTSSAVASQDELRRKLRRRGFHVTQATLSRDMHELRLSKGPAAIRFPTDTVMAR